MLVPDPLVGALGPQTGQWGYKKKGAHINSLYTFPAHSPSPKLCQAAGPKISATTGHFYAP